MEVGDRGHYGTLVLSRAVEDFNADIVSVTTLPPNTVVKTVWETPKEVVCAIPNRVQLVSHEIKGTHAQL